MKAEWRYRLWAGGIAAAVLLVVAGILCRRWVLDSVRSTFSTGRTPDQGLPTLPVSRPEVDMATETAVDFPEFRGKGRHGAVDYTELNPDWTGHPPRLLWRQPVGAGYSAFAVVNGFAVTMEQRGDQEQVTCYAVTSGRRHWTAEWNAGFTVKWDGPRSTPTIADGRVYALGTCGHLVCLDGRTGGVVWRRELVRDLGMDWNDEIRSVRFGRASSPLVVDGLVIVPGGGLRGQCLSLLAFDALTGKRRWSGGDRQISYSSPVLADMLGELQVLIVNEDTVSGHSLKTGEERWSYPWPGNSSVDANVSQPVPLSSSRILLSTGYRRGAAVIELTRRAAGEPMKARCVWNRALVLNTKFTNVVIWDGHAYGLSDGVLECVDLETGDRCWKEGHYGEGQILRVRDLLLVLGATGQLALVRLDPLIPNAVQGRLQALTGTTWNNLALYDHYLLVRNGSEAACYELATCPTGRREIAPVDPVQDEHSQERSPMRER